MLKVAIVGCGKIADSHAAQIQRIAGCKIVAACDREVLMARQLCERFDIPAYFDDIATMLEAARPDVVHIATPPQGHLAQGKLCLERGCHVYMEKPFTLTAPEAVELIAIANRCGKKITAGHDSQFRHAARQMRDLVGKGYLGGKPVHMESFYCYELGATSEYARALMADKNHWVRKLPGQLVQNIISHGIARIAEHFETECPTVVAHGFTSAQLRKAGEEEIVDELRVILSENGSTTAYFTFSSQMRPSLHQFRVYGPANGLISDQDNETLIRLRGARYKSYLEQFVAPVQFAKQYARCAARNGRLFMKRDFHAKAGMKYLIESFYRAITQNSAPPIPYDQILRTARIMDEIFAQISPAARKASSVVR